MEKYLDECLDSLLEQDIPYDEYEIICVNDGSTDGSLEILRRYEKKYSNVRVIDQENGGVCVARNTGLDAARGEYIWFVDSDDFIQTNVLSQIMDITYKSYADRVIVGSYSFKNTHSEEEKEQKKINLIKVNSHYHDSVVWNSVFRRNFLNMYSHRFHYTEITHSEDTLFMFEVMESMPKCVEMDLAIYYYRTHSNSAMTTQNQYMLERKLNSYFVILKIAYEYYQMKQVDRQRAANMSMSYLWETLHTIIKLPYSVGTPFLKELKTQRLFPFKRLPECTLIKSYQTTRTDLVGKIFDKIYINLHTRTGFFCMRVWKMVEGVKHKLEGRP